MAQDQPQDFVMALVPVPGFPQPPAVDDVAHQEQMLAGDAAEKFRQKIASAPARSQMRVGNEDAAIAELRRAGGWSIHVRQPNTARSEPCKLSLRYLSSYSRQPRTS
jgi:hypothetical protein